MTTEKKIQQLIDRADIQDILHAYCRHADNHESASMAALFTEDCIVSYVPSVEESVIRDSDMLKAFIIEHQAKVISSSHYISNLEYIFNSQNAVAVYTSMYSWHRFRGYPVTADRHRLGRYETLMVRVHGSWKIAELRLLSSGEYGGERIGEQHGRPWPPRFENLCDVI